MAHLEHLFVAGVRFDTDMQYLAKVKRVLRYHKLPVLKSTLPLKCAFNSALQCVAIAAQVPIRTLTGEAGRKAQEVVAQSDDQLSESTMLNCIRTFNADISATLTPFVNPPGMGRAALQVLTGGGIALIRYASATGSKWATVIGVEFERGSDYARALLLVDSSASEPWACAHNVRIELLPHQLICRHLTGEASEVQILSLIILQQAVRPRSSTGSSETTAS